MQIEDLKRWHWVAAGIIVGLALAYVWAGVEPQRGRRGSDQDLFRNAVLKEPKTNQPVVHAIVVHPTEQGANGPVNVVTYKKRMIDAKTKQHVSASFWFAADVPYVPTGTRGGSTNVAPNYTIASRLAELQKQHPHVTFNSGWWTTKPATYAIWITGSILVIGGLWPTLLNIVVGAGYGHRRESKAQQADEYDLSRFKGDSRPAPAAPAKPAVSAEEQQRLREMTEQLETKLGGFGQLEAQQAPAPASSGEAPVRKLDGGPLELTPIAAQQDDEEVEIKGEYYPVLIHHKKQQTAETEEGKRADA